MRPFVCKIHGPQNDPYVYWGSKANPRRWPMRRCRICLKQAGLANSRTPQVKARLAAWYQKNRDHRLTQSSSLRAKHKKLVIAGYGGKCECCDEDRSEFLTIDHIFGDGKLERTTTKKGLKLYSWLIKNNFPRDRYRLLCMNCNFSIGKFGYCPHQREKQEQLVASFNRPPAEMPFEIWGH
jgi:hypothetical protein